MLFDSPFEIDGKVLYVVMRAEARMGALE